MAKARFRSTSWIAYLVERFGGTIGIIVRVTNSNFILRFNYIHINPIKHSKLKVRDGAIIIQDGALVVPTSRIANLHDALAQYEFSSYPFYLRKYGKEGMTHVWENYPIRDYLRGDDF